MEKNIPMRDLFSYFRKAWSPRASYHLARIRHGEDWVERFLSACWLMENRIPLTGEAPSMNFQGVK